MKAALLAIAASAGLALTAGTASAHPPGYGGYYGGGYYGGGYYAPRPVVVQPYYVTPVTPYYGYGTSYGYSYAPIRPGFSVTFGSGYGYGSPYVGGFFRW